MFLLSYSHINGTLTTGGTEIDGKLFNLRRLTTKTKVLEKLKCEALFADDCALLSQSESDLQLILNRFSEATEQFGLSIRLEKSEVLFQPVPSTITIEPNIIIDGTEHSPLYITWQCHLK
ncbi:hypothetical protein KIL84_019431 [Mauremys mutica]|uniref:Reverse transcriptase domain-containing protein n=1 Tax=Mauremys mutica TaxID=74926 RepID=A0A9D3XVA0_9SAUR|nr:hypothetical protein KIL84_019431 [Mauremys mutica]